MRSKLGCFIFFMIIITSHISAKNVYYVDATTGNDLNDGLSPATAWKTIAKVNGTLFFPGDNIYFKREEIWREQLTVPSSGSPGNPITFGAFGSGSNPVISGADSLTSLTYVSWTLNLKSGITPEPNQVFFGGTRGNKQTSLAAVNSANDWYWDDGDDLLHIYYTEDPVYYTEDLDGAVVIEASVRNHCITAEGKDYITIQNLTVTKSNKYNITILDDSDYLLIDSITCSYSWRHGFNESIGEGTACDNGTIQNSTFNYNGSHGIKLGETDGWMIDNNVVHNNCISTGDDYTGGIKLWSDFLGTNNTIQNNHIYSNGLTGSRGAGIWIDECGSGHIVRYNHVHGNYFSGIKIEVTDGTQVYYNLVYDETDTSSILHGNGIQLDEEASSNLVYNNTIYNCQVGINVNGKGVAGENVNNLIKNNIVENCTYELRAVKGGENDGTNGSGNVYEYNCFGAEHANFIEWGLTTYKSTYDDWETAYEGTTHSVESDPLMTDPANDKFSLQTGSPCINAGTDVSLTQDYAGNSVPYGWAVDIGAYEYQGSVSPPLYAEINASPTSGWIPLTVNFTGGVSGGTEPYTYSWSFGDGASSSEQNPAYTYSEAGDYTVTLTVTDSLNNEDTDSLIISASEKDDPLEASVTASPTSGEVPLNVNFTGSATGGIPPYSYSWNFGDGASSSKQNPSHTYSAAGNYIVILTVTDSNSSQASDSLTINVYVNSTYQLAVTAATGSPAPGAGGTTDPLPGNHSYSVGNSVQVEAIPNENYRFSKWTGDVSDSETYNEEVNITMDKNKSISAFFCTKCGDVTGDLSITPADSQAAFEIFLGIISNPTESEKENADVDCSGTKTEPNITPGDAQAIFEKFLGINELPSDCSGSSRSGSVLALKRFIPMRQASDVNLIINDVRVDRGGEVVVPIIVDNPFNIKAFGFDLIFPSEILEFAGVERTYLPKDFEQVDANKMAEGLLRVGGYRSKPIMDQSPRVLITLVFRVIGEAKETNSFAIINTVDDIKNVSCINGTLTKNLRK